MITDLFSHKIHSSGEEWPEKLAELAAIFGEFDGQLYDRAAFEARLQRISPRASYLASDAAPAAGARRDFSKFRDEISAYPAYLGLYFLEQSASGWVVRVSETAKRFLLREEPDVAAFLRLQLPLFQYPNAMGAAYRSRTNNLTVQANVRDRTLEFIKQGVHLSPVRLISVALKADAALREVAVTAAAVTYAEIYALANYPGVNRKALPPTADMVAALRGVRDGNIPVPPDYESRFHTLHHTEMFRSGQGHLRLRAAVDEDDADQLRRQLDAICSIESEFRDFDRCTSGQDLQNVIASGKWGQYFDGVMVLPSNIVEALTTDKVLESRESATVPARARPVPPPEAEIYPLKERTGALPAIRPYSRQREMADPEVTRIKRQRRNLLHKELIDKMDSWLRGLGARPKENDHIDLFAKIPSDGSFIFEMKSGGDSLLEQIRKGLSQLYEYRYRYKDTINDPHISLCLVLPELPDSIPWLVDYLCTDREINICWFNDAGDLEWPASCAASMAFLKPPRDGANG